MLNTIVQCTMYIVFHDKGNSLGSHYVFELDILNIVTNIQSMYNLKGYQNMPRRKKLYFFCLLLIAV